VRTRSFLETTLLPVDPIVAPTGSALFVVWKHVFVAGGHGGTPTHSTSTSSICQPPSWF
jgi:hypothetical protein